MKKNDLANFTDLVIKWHDFSQDLHYLSCYTKKGETILDRYLTYPKDILFIYIITTKSYIL